MPSKVPFSSENVLLSWESASPLLCLILNHLSPLQGRHSERGETRKGEDTLSKCL